MNPLEQPIPDSHHTEVGGVVIDEVEAGTGHVKRIVYPPGWHWKTHMQPVTGGDLCQHGHVGMLVQGSLSVEYADGCREQYRAPAVLAIPPGHDGWVDGGEAAIFIQYDCGADTVDRLGLPPAHSH
jgi:hypothetical protein